MIRGSYAGDDWTLRINEKEAWFDLGHRLPGTDSDNYSGHLEYRDGAILLGAMSHEAIRGNIGEIQSTGFAAWRFALREGENGVLELFAGSRIDGPRLALLRPTAAI